ncbi:MAG: general secretion pathway protein GspB, partial [Gammaproteobacteria bacterium]
VSAADAPPARAHVPVPWTALIGILLIVNVIVLAIIFWRSHSQAVVPIAPETPTVASAPAAVESAPAYHPEIRSLAAEAAAMNTPSVVVPANAALATPAASAAKAASTKTAPTITTTAPAAPAIVPATGAGLSAENAPPLDTLPLAFQQSLPPLHLDVHSYAQKPSDRFVIINMQRYQTGDTLKEGPRVIEIVPDGVILEYNGQQFLLPRT